MTPDDKSATHNAHAVLVRALGKDFARLHPQIQQQYRLCSVDNACCVGEACMEQVWHGLPHTIPFLWLGARRRIFFVETGSDVPFTIRNHAYIDQFGRETLTWTREFSFRRRGRAVQRRFDETLIYSERRGCAVVYAGTHQHLAVDLALRVDPDGGLTFRTGAQRLFVGAFTLAFPLFFSGVADVREWFDDRAGLFRVDVQIKNRLWGRIFGYRGWFRLRRESCSPDGIPADIRPRREEPRE